MNTSTLPSSIALPNSATSELTTSLASPTSRSPALLTAPSPRPFRIR